MTPGHEIGAATAEGAMMRELPIDTAHAPRSVDARRIILLTVVAVALVVALQVVVKFVVEQVFGDRVPAVGDAGVERANITTVLGWAWAAIAAVGTALRTFRGARIDLAVEGRIRWWSSFWMSIVGYAAAGVLCWVWAFSEGFSSF